MANIDDKIFTLEEFKNYLKIGRNTALKLLNDGEVKAKKVGRQWRILKSEVDKYLKDHNN